MTTLEMIRDLVRHRDEYGLESAVKLAETKYGWVGTPQRETPRDVISAITP